MSNDVENLRMVYQEMHTIRRYTESLGNKISFTISGVLLIIAGLVIKNDFIVANEDIGITIVVITSGVALSIFYLLKLSVTNKACRVILVRVEQALGFYDKDKYINSKEIKKLGDFPFKESTIIPLRFKELSSSKGGYLLSPNIAAVFVSGICTILAILLT